MNHMVLTTYMLKSADYCKSVERQNCFFYTIGNSNDFSKSAGGDSIAGGN